MPGLLNMGPGCCCCNDFVQLSGGEMSQLEFATTDHLGWRITGTNSIVGTYETQNAAASIIDQRNGLMFLGGANSAATRRSVTVSEIEAAKEDYPGKAAVQAVIHTDATSLGGYGSIALDKVSEIVFATYRYTASATVPEAKIWSMSYSGIGAGIIHSFPVLPWRFTPGSSVYSRFGGKLFLSLIVSNNTGSPVPSLQIRSYNTDGSGETTIYAVDRQSVALPDNPTYLKSLIVNERQARLYFVETYAKVGANRSKIWSCNYDGSGLILERTSALNQRYGMVQYSYKKEAFFHTQYLTSVAVTLDPTAGMYNSGTGELILSSANLLRNGSLLPVRFGWEVQFLCGQEFTGTDYIW